MRQLGWVVYVILLVTNLSDANTGHQEGEMCLRYEEPATSWMTEALPIGNGPMGAMLFGGTDTERIQFNEISLWSGDRLLRADKEKENMTWKEGQLTGAVIRSRSGQDCRVVYGTHICESKTEAGKTYPLDRQLELK